MLVTRTITIPADADFDTLYQVTLAEWYYMPTLEQGHFDNLKFDNGKFRVWRSRMTLADYGGDSRAYLDDRLTIEKLENGVWRKLDRYGR